VAIVLGAAYLRVGVGLPPCQGWVNLLRMGGDAMSGTGADGPVEGARGEVGRLIITSGSAVVFGAVGDCLHAPLGRDRDRCINARRHHSVISGLSSRNYLDDQGRSRSQQDEKDLILRSGSPRSDIASVPECNSTG
jgi:hypothetical protein